MIKKYNRFVLIGNGFDRALGLETSYSDFIFHYIHDEVITALTEPRDSTLVSIAMEDYPLYTVNAEYIAELKKLTNLKDLLEFIKGSYKIIYNFKFFEQIVLNHLNSRWVDIEMLYYKALLKEFNYYEKIGASDKILPTVIELNECMDNIAIELRKYIIKAQAKFNFDPARSPMIDMFKSFDEPLNNNRFKLIARHNRENSPASVFFINFNYTNTVQHSLNSSLAGAPVKKQLHIHGNVFDEGNPIIFGYGDDTGREYKELELAGGFELLRKIKSFEYPRTHNYHNLLNYIANCEFDVFIVGHSCGLSDKTLLKTIFQHPNCLAIQNYHYKGEPEDFNKRMQISRHFDDKPLMREKVLPFNEFATIPQNTRPLK